jgi:hypothetical protein
MAEFIVTKVGEFIFSKLLETLYENLGVPKFWDFVRGQGLQENLDKWRTTLQAIQKMLDDAEEKQYTDTDVKEWLDDLRHLIYDVDDIVDELTTKASTIENEARPSKVPKLIPSAWLTPRYFEIDSTLRSKIKEVTDGLNDILTRKGQLNLKETGDGRSHMKTGVRAPTSVLTEPRVYGREKDKEAVLELLLGEKCSEAGVSVIPILGMGGIGKTTLAQLLFNDEKVQSFFDLKAWACVSQDFDVDRVTKAILQSLTPDNCDGMDRNWLQVKLKERLNGKKFIVVLDDLWNENYPDWTILLAPFLAGTPESKIIITTRNERVALMTGGNNQAHCLQVLSKDDCLSLFTQHALGVSDFSAHQKLQDIGKKIVEKCRGLPLAAKILGGLLRTTQDPDEWEKVLQSKIWDIPEESKGILPALMLSYHHLPSHLKRCFAYCSIFPKDYEFEEEQLVLLWMAEGLIRSQEGDKQMEDLGSRYFHDLLSRSFFQQSNIKELQFDRKHSGLDFYQSSMKKSRFVMHDLINDLAQTVAGDICFRMEDRIGGSDGSRLPKKARHSSYLGARYDRTEKFKAFFELKCLRMFLPLMLQCLGGCYLTHNVPLQLLPKLLCLRVLSLSGYCIVQLPNSIGDLKHLRYLDLSYTLIRDLPESTTTLYNLQTLKLENCFYLKELPSKLGNLINLRHLNILNANKLEEMPPQIGKLTFLHTLSNLIVGKGNYFVLKELGSLLRLRGTLIISRLENAIELRDTSDAKLIEKLDLIALRLEWSANVDDSQDRTSELDVLNMLHPNKALKELTIRCYGGTKFPTWLRDPSFPHVVLLRIENCKKCTSLPPVGQLPSLKHLFIEGMASVKNVDNEFYGKGSSQRFRSLEILHFKNMKEWENWSPNGGFPHLLELYIQSCPKLEKLAIWPSPSLKVLSIAGMDSVKNIGHEFYGKGCSQPFGFLETLRFKDMKEWENWRSNGEFPRLLELYIENCPKLLGELPNHLPSLKTVVIQQCQGLQHSNSTFREKRVECRSEADFSLLMSNSLSWISERLIFDVEVLAFKDSEEMTHLSSNVLALLQLLPSLRVLRFDECQKLVSFVAEGKEPFPCTLRKIDIRNCKALESLPKAVMYNNTCLEKIKIYGCDSLKHFAIGQLPQTLKRLVIRSCQNMVILVDDDDTNSRSSSTSLLEYLLISECPSLKSLIPMGELPSTLKDFDISCCEKLESIAESFHPDSSLENFFIYGCENLKSLPMGIHTLNHLEKVSIFECPSLVSFPDRGYLPGNIKKLWISKLALHDSILSITSLQDLKILSCPGVVSFPEEGFLANLTSLEISNSNMIEALIEWGLHRLTSLKYLKINGCPNLESFPEKMLPASLSRITIERFHHLKLLSSKGFRNLASLEELNIVKCENLTSFPEDGFPPSLEILLISGCPRLKESCKNDEGREWSKIAHIPRVEIDGRFVYDTEAGDSEEEESIYDSEEYESK